LAGVGSLMVCGGSFRGRWMDFAFGGCMEWRYAVGRGKCNVDDWRMGCVWTGCLVVG